MRILVYFRGRVLDSQGTPLRCRNICQSLAAKPGVSCLLVSRDASAEIRERLPEVEHSRAPSAAEGPRVLGEATLSYRPDVIYGQTHKGAFDLARLETSVPRVADLHGDLPAWRLEQDWRSWSWRLYWFARDRWSEGRALPKLDGLTVVSEDLKRRLSRFGKPMIKLWGGVDPGLFGPGAEPDSSRIRIAYAGNYNPYHGVSTLIDAVARLRRSHPDIHLTLIGAIDKFPKVRERAMAAIGENLELTGLLPYDAVPGKLKQADVLVIPRARSRTARSTYPSKLSEYLAMGKAVIAADVGEVGQVVSDGDNGLLVAPESVSDLHRALSLAMDPELRRRLGDSARSFAEEHLAWEVVSDRLLGFLSRIADQGRGQGASPPEVGES